MKKKDDDRWGMGWQGSTKDNIEDVLKGAIEHFLKKWFVLPEFIYVNPDVDLKVYGNIPLKKDKQMFTRGMVLLIIPKTVEIQK